MAYTADIAFVLLILLCIPSTSADTVTIDPTVVIGSWEGWGVSLAWWANVFGTRDDIADVIFGMGVYLLNGISLEGLGLNIARYNIGGSGKKVIHQGCPMGLTLKRSMHASRSFPPHKQIDTFWTDWFSEDPASASWDWTVDKAQIAMLQKAQARGANILEAFSNSPPWWMTYSSSPQGAYIPLCTNLSMFNHARFSLYIATVLQHFKNRLGITFTWVSPFNEPSHICWSYPSGTQEGCHISRRTQAHVLHLLRRDLEKFGLAQHTHVAASDETNPDAACASLTYLNGCPDAVFEKVNVHGYGFRWQPYRGSGTAQLRKIVDQSPVKRSVWVSEYGEGDASGIQLAVSIARDIHLLVPTAWVYWQPLDGGGWGLLDASLAPPSINNINQKYHVFAHYTRHIRPGMCILCTSHEHTVVAYDAKEQKLVIVTVNISDTPSQVVYDLAKLVLSQRRFAQWITHAGKAYVRVEESGAGVEGLCVAEDGKLCITFPPLSVATLEISGVTGVSSV